MDWEPIDTDNLEGEMDEARESVLRCLDFYARKDWAGYPATHLKIVQKIKATHAQLSSSTPEEAKVHEKTAWGYTREFACTHMEERMVVNYAAWLAVAFVWAYDPEKAAKSTQIAYVNAPHEVREIYKHARTEREFWNPDGDGD